MIGLLRLRKCSKEGTFRPELTKQQSSIVRELHVYGVCVCVCVCVVEDEAREDRQFKVQDGQLGQGLGVRGVSNNCGRDGTCVCKAVPVYARDYA